MGNPTCTVEGCEKPARSATAELCPMHYHRVYRYGTLNPVHPPRYADLTGQRYGTLVPAHRQDGKWLCHCDCGATRLVSVGELRREGQANTCGVKRNHRSDSIGYSAAHERVRTERGPARDQPCKDCGRRAAHWSYNHRDPDQRTSHDPRTAGTPYSLDPAHYEPRCVPCHKRYDLDRITTNTRSIA